MKRLNHVFKLSLIFGISICLALISGCGRPTITHSTDRTHTRPPCAKYGYGSVRFENISKKGVIVRFDYNPYPVGSRSSSAYHEIDSGRYSFEYEEGGKWKGSGTIEICDCETTIVSLPSRRRTFTCRDSP